MAISFEFRRHSIKDGPAPGTIGPKGFALARRVGESQLRGKGFTHFFVSALWRTHQTLAAFDEGAGDFHLKFSPHNAPFYLRWPELNGLWQVCAEEAKFGYDMLQTALKHNYSLTQRAAMAVGRKFDRWARKFPDNSRVLVVGHSPYMELIPFGLLGRIMPGLNECQGFRLSTDRAFYNVDWKSRDLDPSYLPVQNP